MPSKDELKVFTAATPADLRSVRIPGLTKSFEQLTISELVQLRPGSAVSDTWEVNAVTDNISATTSAALEALGRVHKDMAVNQVVNQAKLNSLRTKLTGAATAVSFSADEPSPNEVLLGTEDLFTAAPNDPFKV